MRIKEGASKSESREVKADRRGVRKKRRAGE